MADIAVALLAVQFVENDAVRIWSNGLGPLTINALAALIKKKKNINSVELTRDFTSSIQ
jgi:hypothetical protein